MIKRMIELPGEQLNADKLLMTFALASTVQFSSIFGLLKAVQAGYEKFVHTYYPKTRGEDGAALFGILCVPFFIYYEFVVGTGAYNYTSIIAMNVAFVLDSLASEMKGNAVYIGKSARVNAVSQVNAFALVIFFAIMYLKPPTALEVMGILIGLVGVLILTLSEFDEMAVS